MDGLFRRVALCRDLASVEGEPVTLESIFVGLEFLRKRFESGSLQREERQVGGNLIVLSRSETLRFTNVGDSTTEEEDSLRILLDCCVRATKIETPSETVSCHCQKCANKTMNHLCAFVNAIRNSIPFAMSGLSSTMLRPRM
jgi:hypothetical protein